MGNGRTGSGPGSYNNRDQDRGKIPLKYFLFVCNRIMLNPSLGEKGERWADNRAPSRDSTEEFGEWKQPNGDGYQRDKDREFRRYDDNLQVFVGNIPHVTTEEALKVFRFAPIEISRILMTILNRNCSSVSVPFLMLGFMARTVYELLVEELHFMLSLCLNHLKLLKLLLQIR